MAAPKTRSANLPRPKRTLILFLAALVAAYGLVALLDATSKKGDASAWKPKLGLDLQGGTRITFEAKAESGKVTADKLRQARDIIDQRVNGTGVTEAEVTTTTADQKIVDDLDWTKLSLDQLIKAETQGVATLPKEFQTGVASLQKIMAGFVCDPGNIKVNDVSNKPLVTCDPVRGEVEILSPTVIEGTQVKSADAVIPQQQVQWVVALALKGEGKKAFDTITEQLFAQTQAGNDAGSRFAIVLDGETLSAPSSQFHSVDGRSQISGDFTAKSAKDLANQLKYGALPLTFGLNGVSEEGPSLAGSQLKAGLVAGLVGMILVVLFLLFYYRGLGLVAVGSLLISAAMTYVAVLLLGKSVGFTLTLPGIAGLIVAIGITADSFIVFFERIRDEVREGKSLRLAVEAGWVRARTTILAADGVSILAALVLFIFAIGVVRGFAFALGLTTIIDIFVVFLFTKPLVSLLARTKFFGQGHKLSGLDAAHLGISGRKVSELARTSTSTTAGSTPERGTN